MVAGSFADFDRARNALRSFVADAKVSAGAGGGATVVLAAPAVPPRQPDPASVPPATTQAPAAAPAPPGADGGGEGTPPPPPPPPPPGVVAASVAPVADEAATGSHPGAPAPTQDEQIRQAAVTLRKARYEYGLAQLESLGMKVMVAFIFTALAAAVISLVAFHNGASDRIATLNAAECGPPTSDSTSTSSSTTSTTRHGDEGEEEAACSFNGRDATRVAYVAAIAIIITLGVASMRPPAGSRSTTNGGANGGGAPAPVAQALAPEEPGRSRGVVRWFLFLVAFAAGAGGFAALIWAVWRLFDQAVEQGVGAEFAARSLASTIGLLLAAGILCMLAIHRSREGGLLAYIVGADNRLSTSYTQAALWTIAIAVSALIICFNRLLLDEAFDGVLDNLDSTYLLLLGGPFAAAVAAKAITTSADGRTIQKIEGAAPSPRDIIADDEGRADLVDAQFLVFNLVALIIFVVTFANDIDDLPRLPAALAGLTTVSGLTYLGHKATLRNMPQISSITGAERGPITAGSRIVLTGSNFVPAGASDEELLCDMRVTFDGISTPVVWGNANDNDLADPRLPGRLSVTVPVGVAPKASSDSVMVTVTTSAGVVSDPYAMTMAATTPYIRAPSPAVLTPGQVTELHGMFFGGPSGMATVQVGSLRVTPTYATDEVLRFTVPLELPTTPTTVAVKVLSLVYGESPPIDVPVA